MNKYLVLLSFKKGKFLVIEKRYGMLGYEDTDDKNLILSLQQPK